MSTVTKNLCGKTRKVNDPYEIYVMPGWEWRVLKKYQVPEKEAENPYARWFCAVQGPGTFGSYDMGDTYVKDIVTHGDKMSPEQMAAHLAENHWREY